MLFADGSFEFKNNVVDNTGQNLKKSMQYGQEEVSAELTFFAVDDNDPNNPLNILQEARKNRQAVPIYYKAASTTSAEGFDGDMIVEVAESALPDSNEVKSKVTMHPCNNYRVWEDLAGVAPVTVPIT